ncbi:MAG: arylsulfatase [Saprospiraceae bacterium]|nr:arylsulfatase [Saprospiraceae bacterium]
MRHISFGIILILFLFGCATELTQETKPPNIIYILADDLGWGDLGCYNSNSKINTPHLDQFAREGMLFTDAHAPAAVCTPTRYGILTGRYCWRSRLPVGVLRGYGRALIEPERMTVAHLLKGQGYHCGVVGKWHLGLDWVVRDEYKDSVPSDANQVNDVGMVTEMDPQYIDFSKKPTDGPLNHGFDYSFILPASLDMDPYCFLEDDILVASPSEYTPGNDLNTGYTGAFWRAGKIAPDFDMVQVTPTFTKKAIEFVECSVEKKEPFFLYLPFPSPHTPWVPTADFKNTSYAGPYGDFTSMVDAMVGEILQKLREHDLDENTLVVFTSDNGPFWTAALVEKYNHQAAGTLRGMKADAWEGGHRIPFIVRWPGKIEAGSKCDTVISLTNLMATCADILGLQLEENQGEDSHSIWPLLSGRGNYQAPEALIQHSSKNYFAIRQGEWKLIAGLGSGGFSEPSLIEPRQNEPVGQLYNLKQDLAESDNLYALNPEKVAELMQLLEKFRDTGRSR